ncbi:hypothetical protein [Vibrio mediterranei]|uniref:hypothetical protein n=1 Tax=Vibrio mediterranei TaxID=689 RepID=UPI00406771DD
MLNAYAISRDTALALKAQLLKAHHAEANDKDAIEAIERYNDIDWRDHATLPQIKFVNIDGKRVFDFSSLLEEFEQLFEEQAFIRSQRVGLTKVVVREIDGDNDFITEYHVKGNSKLDAIRQLRRQGYVVDGHEGNNFGDMFCGALSASDIKWKASSKAYICPVHWRRDW